MGLFDFLEGGAAFSPGSEFADKFEGIFPGSFSITFGSTLSAVMPVGQIAHIYGDSIQYTVDWEGIIIDGFLGKIPAVKEAMESGPGSIASALVAGTGGYVNFVYGRNVGAVYGSTTTVQRGPSTSISGNSWLFGGDVAFGGGGGFTPPKPTKGAEQAAVDKAVDVATTVLSGVMILAGLAAEILAGTVYKGGGEEDPSAQVNKQLKFGASFITSRFMGMIIAIEKMGQDTRNAIYRAPSIEDQLNFAKNDLEALENVLVPNAIDLTKRLKQVEDDTYAAEQFLRAGLNQLSNVVAGVSAAADEAQQSVDEVASRTSLEVANYEVAADGQILLRAGGAVLVEAMQEGGAVLVDADTVASVRSGAAKLILQGGAGAAEAVLTSGLEGTTRLRSGLLDLGSDVQLTPEETSLQVGVPDLGANITMTPESIVLSVGAPGVGASITLTPESIILKVAENTFMLTPAGIAEEVLEATREMTAEGHNFTAAETEFNIGVSGFTSEGPTKLVVVEGGTVEEETVAEATTDAARNQNAGIILTV